MQMILKLEVVDDSKEVEHTEIWRCDDVGTSSSPGHLGLSLSDGKTICAALQQAVAERQVACLAAERVALISRAARPFELPPQRRDVDPGRGGLHRASGDRRSSA